MRLPRWHNAAMKHIDPILLSRYRGCLTGGAVGDALGAPVEFMSRAQILQRFGAPGIRDYVSAYGRVGAITDDTQMTLFSAEGLLRAAAQGHPPGHAAYVAEVAQAYQRWLLTQGETPQAHRSASGLLAIGELHSRRAPGMTCLDALRQAAGAATHGAAAGPRRASNNSKGCGGVMRVAPAGLLLARMIEDRKQLAREAFALGADLAAITHGHPSGFLPAGVLAAMVALLAREVSMPDALASAIEQLVTHSGYEETLAALQHAERLAAEGRARHDAMVQLGGGWVGEEALAMSVYCALACSEFESALVLAVNHAGDSDSTGAITGNLMGAWLGEQSIPERWLEGLELVGVVGEMAVGLVGVAAGPRPAASDPCRQRRIPA
jgi:ADP-ribosyl-[dinitrogen reductase] hydrolase